MSDRDRIDRDLEELSPKYDDFVTEAIDFAENRLSAAQMEGFRQRLKTDEMFRRVVEPVLDAWEAPQSSPAQLRESWEDMRSRIAEKTGTVLGPWPEAEATPSPRVQPIRKRVGFPWWLLAKAAAVFVGIILIPTSVWLGVILVNIKTVETQPNVVSVVRLPDATSVRLGPSSKLQYPKNHGTKPRRWVVFQGEGTFTVTPSATQPFIVETELAHVTVVGTRFTVLADDSSTVVNVEEGSVSVQTLDANKKPIGTGQTLSAGARARVTSAGILNEPGKPSSSGVNP